MTPSKQPWQKTSSEVYDDIFMEMCRLLDKGSLLPLRLGDKLMFVSNRVQVRQGATPKDMQIKTAYGWRGADVEDLDEWARTLGLTGPSEHFDSVFEAVKENRPVPKEVLKDYAAIAGLDRKSAKDARSRQMTRTVDRFDREQEYEYTRPKVGETVLYHAPGLDDPLSISRVVSYRTFDQTWIVELAAIEQPFVVQRICDDEYEGWGVYGRSF